VENHYVQNCEDEVLILDIYWDVPSDVNTDYLSYRIQELIAAYFRIDIDQVHVTILNQASVKRQDDGYTVVTISILVSDPEVSAASSTAALWSLMGLFVFVQALLRF
jgi:hypothetical protein